MKYTIDGRAKIEVDTSTNKIVISTANKRIAITPVTRGGSDVYAVVNDKPGPQITSATQLVRFLVQALIDKRVVKSLAKEPTNG